MGQIAPSLFDFSPIFWTIVGLVENQFGCWQTYLLGQSEKQFKKSVVSIKKPLKFSKKKV
jgi:hypothetical protein